MKIFITGGSSGIGLGLAKKYLEQKHEVAVCGRSEEKIKKLQERFPELKTYKVDVKDKLALKRAVEDFAKEDLDMMIAGAGVYYGNLSKELDQEGCIHSLDTNLAGVLHAFEIARDIMLPKKQGHLVAISSIAGLLEYRDASVYSKSKRAVNYLCEAYREALRGTGIYVTNILPGYIATQRLYDVNGETMRKKPFLLSEEEAVNISMQAITEKRERIIFPRRMKIAVSILSKFPKSIINFLFLLTEKRKAM
ncbi:SDR family NAD(P)-dependent oxidoreductase [Fusobacterium necrophorum]|uniref:SDR family NAD(P)-dependent oxidoreductase n=1 Tax=Fusobacterium necrophorum TaxID=859 RepID=UPI003FA160C6